MVICGLVLVLVVVSGCQTIGFYSQALKGQYQLFAHEQSIDRLLANSNTPPKLKARLLLVEDLRGFAKDNLKLPVKGHYKKYVDVHRSYVVWNVEAAPEFSLQPRAWWYPLVGSLEYRGYFSEKGARNYGDKLAKKGNDVFIGGVQAYSTLGWFEDPLLNTFIFEPEPDLAEVLFHELGHQRVFARGDTDFNEAFATAVGQEGARRWLRSKNDQSSYNAYVNELERTVQFVNLVMKTRKALKELYGDQQTEDGKLKATAKNKDVPTETLRQQKLQVLQQLQTDYADLKQQWGGAREYDGWFARKVNNAQLNSVAAYYDLVPGFERLIEISGNDLEKFYNEAEKLSKMPKTARHQWLQRLALGRQKPAPELAPVQTSSQQKSPSIQTN
jgi:predicted aminopeptidase